MRSDPTTIFSALAHEPDVERVALEPDQTLISEGADDRIVYVLESGRLRVTKEIDDATSVIALIDEPGSVIGEMAVLVGGRRSASIVADEDSQLLAIPADVFSRLVGSDPELSEQLVALATRRAEEGELAHLLTEHFGISDDGTLVATCQRVQWRHLAPGEVLLHQGDPSESVFFVVRGRLEATALHNDGHEEMAGEIGRGEVVGEIGLLSGEPRSATVRATRNSVVAELREREFLGLVETHPRMMIEVCLDAVHRASSPRWHSAPTRTIGVIAAPGLDAPFLANHIEAELSRHGNVVRLSRSNVDAALDWPGISDSPPGGVEDIRIGRLVHESEIAADFLLVELGHQESGWFSRGSSIVDQLLVFVPADDDQATTTAAAAAKQSGIARTTVVIVHPRQVRAVGSAEIAKKVGATNVRHVAEDSPEDFGRVARLAVGLGNGLVLGGGGARGYGHIGVVRALQESGFEIDFVAGSSMGGVVGAAFADGMDADALTEWAAKYFPSVLDYTLPVVGLIKAERIASYATETFGERDIEDLWLPYLALSTDLTASQVHRHDSGRVNVAIRATSAIPGVMPPVPQGEALLVDAGVLNNLPIDEAREISPSGRIVAVDVAPPRGPGAHGDYGLSVSGWKAMASKFGRQRSPYPKIAAILLRSMITASMRSRDQLVRDGVADLYLDLDMRGASMLDFADPASIAQQGYDLARPHIVEWLSGNTPVDSQTIEPEHVVV